MRHVVLLIMLLCLTIPLHAQDDGYTIAQQRLENFPRSSEYARVLDLSGLSLTAIPPELWQLTNLDWLILSDYRQTWRKSKAKRG